uniref:F-box domain-containing protein n=1 Tax=Leersia perrieri TaxID=77586 RepID=A0A0D9X983_9ORYZ
MLSRNITSEGKDPIKTYKRGRNITSTGKETIITYKRRRVRRCDIPEVPEELITEILLRLPVRSLARFKCVCKAWQNTISDPIFVRSHLLHSATKQEQKPSFLITPHKLDTVIDDEDWPTTFSNNFSFFQWQYGNDNMRLLHAMNFHGEFHSVGFMSHCDGLVLFPTDTNVYVINPATGDVLKLPEGQKDAKSSYWPTVGFGFDPRSNTYKVARYFYRSVNYTMQTYDAGMEVFTIGQDGSDCWREIVESPPYSLHGMQVAVHCKGSLIWMISEMLAKPHPNVLLRFSLENENFSLIPYPCTSLPIDQYI